MSRKFNCPHDLLACCYFSIIHCTSLGENDNKSVIHPSNHLSALPSVPHTVLLTFYSESLCVAALRLFNDLDTAFIKT